MTNWKELALGEIVTMIDYRGKTPKKTSSGIPLITAKIVKNGRIYPPTEFISKEEYKERMTRGLPKVGDVLITTEAPLGEIAELKDANVSIGQRLITMRADENMLHGKYLKYYLQSKEGQSKLSQRESGTTVIGIKQAELRKVLIPLPPLEMQKKIAGVLGALDDKIELNNKINNNLEQQAQALFKSWFVDKLNPNRKTIRAEEFFNISIGKTPPRKEPEWFSENSNDVKWVSISDMGNCGMFISDSSEYLISSAISKFNVKLVPSNTVLLSFKLTVGRIAITDGEMTTNEAIAHFVTNKTEINEYLYCYLKNFNFQTMGSTSSIATAVNSKIIKSMPFVMPEENELKDFHSVVSPMFAQIKFNQRENTRLAQLRDTLLPKLMSGEIDVSNVDISALTSTDKLSFTEE